MASATAATTKIIMSDSGVQIQKGAVSMCGKWKKAKVTKEWSENERKKNCNSRKVRMQCIHSVRFIIYIHNDIAITKTLKSDVTKEIKGCDDNRNSTHKVDSVNRMFPIYSVYVMFFSLFVVIICIFFSLEKRVLFSFTRCVRTQERHFFRIIENICTFFSLYNSLFWQSLSLTLALFTFRTMWAH